ncbi:hypothetical protein VPH35_099398 [Triticum aestivum]|uniref:Uncharacterized protein n=1 Tax=Aegilops tauschii TaxID=37682 RepID=M8CMB6_AEGTA
MSGIQSITYSIPFVHRSIYLSLRVAYVEIVTRHAMAMTGKLKIDYQGTEISLKRRRETKHRLVEEAIGVDLNSFGDVESAKNAAKRKLDINLGVQSMQEWTIILSLIIALSIKKCSLDMQFNYHST